MNFKNWMKISENEDKEDKLRNLINANGLILFFQKDESMFGCPENSRIAFARMKSEKDEEANFSAINLSSDEPAQHIIQFKDLDNLKVVDMEDVIGKITGK